MSGVRRGAIDPCYWVRGIQEAEPRSPLVSRKGSVPLPHGDRAMPNDGNHPGLPALEGEQDNQELTRHPPVIAATMLLAAIVRMMRSPAVPAKFAPIAALVAWVAALNVEWGLPFEFGDG